MKIPSVHLNGTGGVQLRDANLHAYAMLLNAIEAARQAAPNARDFYVQSNEAFGIARAEHEQRILELQRVASNFCAIYEGVQEQLDEADRRRRPKLPGA